LGTPDAVYIYGEPMKFTVQLFWEGELYGGVAPLFTPLTLDLSSADRAREVAKKVAAHRDVPAHSFTIKSEDGTLSERWFQLDGAWNQGDSGQS